MNWCPPHLCHHVTLPLSGSGFRFNQINLGPIHTKWSIASFTPKRTTAFFTFIMSCQVVEKDGDCCWDNYGLIFSISYNFFFMARVFSSFFFFFLLMMSFCLLFVLWLKGKREKGAKIRTNNGHKEAGCCCCWCRCSMIRSIGVEARSVSSLVDSLCLLELPLLCVRVPSRVFMYFFMNFKPLNTLHGSALKPGTKLKALAVPTTGEKSI